MGDPSEDRNPPAGQKPSLIEVAFPKQATLVFCTAVAMGLLLICCATVLRVPMSMDGVQASLILCVGVALMLAAFGGQANVKLGSFILVGVAAIAVGLFVLHQRIMTRQYLTGEIRGLDLGYFSDNVVIAGKNQLLGAPRLAGTNGERSKFEFVIFKDELQSDRLELVLQKRSDKKEVVYRVPVSAVEWAFSAQQGIIWELKAPPGGGERKVFDTRTRTFVSVEDVASLPSASEWTWDFQLIGTAHAQSAPLSSERIRQLLDGLRIEETTLRRGARDGLSAASAAAIPAMMEEFRKDYADYRVRLGICVALAQMLHLQKEKAAEISAKLGEEDLELLLRAAGDEDRTVRLYATQFLLDLSDARVAKRAISGAATTTNPNARYNWLFLAKTGWSRLTPDEKGELAPSLAKAKQNADKSALPLFDQLM